MYLTDANEFVFKLDENKTYEIKKQETIDIDTLDDSKIFNDGVLTYNNQKIAFLDFNNNIIWENQNRDFENKIFLDRENVYRSMDNGLEIIDKNNQAYMIVEIPGEIVHVSRETNKKYIIADNKNGQNSLHIINDNNEVVDEKLFEGIITNVSISEKSQAYFVTSLNNINDKLVNTISFNLIDDLELWTIEIEDELIIGTSSVNNNLLVIGTKHIYLFNEHGKLMWKNINYSNVRNFKVNKKTEEIYILFEKNDVYELVSYNYEGKVKSIYKVPSKLEKIEIINNRIFIYNENTIYLTHNNKSDKLFEIKEGLILDFYVENDNIYILTKDKLIKGQIG